MPKPDAFVCNQPNQVFVRYISECTEAHFDLAITQQHAGLLSFISAEEYKQLMEVMNESMETHHPCTLKTGPACICASLLAPLGGIFLLWDYRKCLFASRVNKDMDQMSIVQKMKARGIQLTLYGSTDWVQGGMLFGLPQGAGGVPVPVAMGGAATMQIQVPANAAGGSVVQVQAPDGRTVQVTVPAGLKVGDVFTAQL